MAKTLADYANQVTGKKCVGCGQVFERSLTIDYHDDDGGWVVYGFDRRQWLSVKCSRCGHVNALWKLGIIDGYVPIESQAR